MRRSGLLRRRKQRRFRWRRTLAVGSLLAGAITGQMITGQFASQLPAQTIQRLAADPSVPPLEPLPSHNSYPVFYPHSGYYEPIIPESTFKNVAPKPSTVTVAPQHIQDSRQVPHSDTTQALPNTFHSQVTTFGEITAPYQPPVQNQVDSHSQLGGQAAPLANNTRQQDKTASTIVIAKPRLSDTQQSASRLDASKDNSPTLSSNSRAETPQRKSQRKPNVRVSDRLSTVSEARLDEGSNHAADFSPSSRTSQRVNFSALQDQIEGHLKKGVSLAERGAHFSAEQEFFSALRMISQALDSSSRSHNHEAALDRAVMALEEAKDFEKSAERRYVGQNVSATVAYHKTAVILHQEVRDLSAVAAMQVYYQFAGDQFAKAVGTEPLASQALYALGKLYASTSESKDKALATAAPRAILFFEAALAVDSKNYAASNELGVLMARYGRLEDAKQLLNQSLAISPLPDTWHNLAVVHERLGQPELAAQARQNEKLTPQTTAAKSGLDETASPALRWVTPDEFNEAAGQSKYNSQPTQYNSRPNYSASFPSPNFRTASQTQYRTATRPPTMPNRGDASWWKKIKSLVY